MDRVDVSKQMSYWLRHDPEDLEMDENGYVEIDELVGKLKERFPDVDRKFVEEMVEEGKQRYEIEGDKVRAIYGHSMDIDLDLPEDKEVKELYHGTTSKGAYNVLINGLQAKDRSMVHLSATRDTAEEVAKRRTEDPVVLKVDVESAREDGLRFYRATDDIYLSRDIPMEHIEKCEDF